MTVYRVNGRPAVVLAQTSPGKFLCQYTDGDNQTVEVSKAKLGKLLYDEQAGKPCVFVNGKQQ